MPVGGKQILRFGPYQLDTECGQLRKNGLGLKLQGQPVQILEILLETPGQLVTREEIRQRLWSSDTFVDFDHSLNTAIKRLRQALGDEADTPQYIETLPKRGYRFIGEVNHAGPKDEPGTPLAEPTLSQQPVSDMRRRRWKMALATFAVALLTIAALAVVYWVVKPPLQPRIVGSQVLTKTGYPKAWLLKPIVNGGSAYFSEQRPSGWVTLQVPTAGGEVLQPLTVSDYFSRDESRMLWASDVSRDGSELLAATCDPHFGPINMRLASNHTCDVWSQPLPSGTPRLIVRDAVQPIWAADGRSIFFTNNNLTELYRANADGTGVERLATVPTIYFPHLSRDGSRIRFTGPSPAFPMWEVGVDRRNPHPILSGFQGVVGGSWSPDGKYYFFSSLDGDRSSLWAVSEARHWWRKANTSLPQQLTFGPLSIGNPAISKDGKQLYAVGTERRGELSAYDSKSGKFVPYLGGESICMVDFSRDGQWIAFVTYPEGTLWRSRIDGSERRQLTGPLMAVTNPRWSPDGKLIAFWDMSNGDRRKINFGDPQRIYVVSADGGGPVLLLAGYFADPTWSPDGRSIAYSYFHSPASEVRILDLQTQKSTTVRGSQGMWSPRWSADGKYLVALAPPYTASKLMLFDFASNTWKELASGTNLGWPCWSRDSKFVFAQDGEALVRVAISHHKKEQIASLQGLRFTSYYFDRVGGGWFGLTPDDRPLTTRDTGIQEIYAFDLEYK